jgi:hypothetical protein
MKTKNYICFFLSLFYSCILQAQYSQSTTAEFSANTNFNISTLNDELKLTPELGTGADGDLYIAPGGTTYTDDVKTFITGINLSGQNALQVNSSAGFNIGDEILIITMQDNNTDLNTNIAGQYEFKRILTKLSTALILTENLVNTYDTTGKKHQVLTIPNYNSVTIDYGGILTCDDWDGIVGGIICFRSKGSVQINALAKIDATAKGYLGGPKVTDPGGDSEIHGIQGQSILENGYYGNYINNCNSGGAGLASALGVWAYAGGGGGGSYSSQGTAGESGGATGGNPGETIGNIFLNKLFMGGSGGSGADNAGYNGWSYGESGKGGDGGGIILFSCDSLAISGSIISTGEVGGDAQFNPPVGSGGGGAGGSIFIQCLKSVNISNEFFKATGNNGGVPIGGGTGGLGGDGRIRIDAPNITGTTIPPIGYNGISYALIGSSTTQPLIKSTTQCWNVLTFNKNTTAPGTSVTIDVLSNSNTLLQSNVNSGSILTAVNDTIKLKISLLNSFGNQTPVFYDWMLTLATAPSAIITPAGNTTFCQGNSVVLNANSGTGYTYQWLLNGTSINGANNSSYTATQGGSYAVVVTSGCSATSLPMLVTVNPIPPTPAISQNGNVLSSIAPTGNQWYLNGTIVPGATNQTLNVVDNGAYFVIVTLNGCISDTSNLITYTSGIRESNSVYNISIYPNPSSAEFQIFCDLDTPKEVTFKVIDYLGKSLYYAEPKKYIGKIEKSIQLSGLPSGIYKLIVIIDNETITKNIAIQK